MSSLSSRSFLLLTLLILIVSLANYVDASSTPSREGPESSLIEARHFLMPKNGALVLAEDLVDPCTLSTTTPSHASSLAKATSALSKTTAKSTSTAAKTTAIPSTSPTSTKTTTKSSTSTSTKMIVNPTPTTSSKLVQVAAPTNTPRFVIYDDEPRSGFPNPSAIQGFNTYILAFYLSTAGPVDLAEMWTSLSASQRASMKADYAAVGVTDILVSAFGSTDIPTTLGVDPITIAKELAEFVVDLDLGDVDIDYEDFSAVQAGTAVAWLVSLTTQLRSSMGPGKILTHAPVAPWFGKGELYLELHEKVGNDINWYNVQFYSQGPLYTTCESLITKSGGIFPGTSVFEIIAAGIPQQVIVIGKPGVPADVGVSLRRSLSEHHNQIMNGSHGSHLDRRQTNTNGFIDPATLATCVSEAKNMGWSAGVMSWEFPDADAAWIKTVRGSAFPM